MLIQEHGIVCKLNHEDLMLTRVLTISRRAMLITDLARNSDRDPVLKLKIKYFSLEDMDNANIKYHASNINLLLLHILINFNLIKELTVY